MSINHLKERALRIPLTGSAERGFRDACDYYTEKLCYLSESSLICVLRHLIDGNFDFGPKIIRPQAFLPASLTQKLKELREEVKENSGLILFQGKVFSDSITLEDSLLSIGERPVLAQEILPTAIALFLGLEPFGIPGERNEQKIQSGAKVNPKAAVNLQKGRIEPRSINGTGARDFHIDNPQEEKYLPTDLVFGATGYQGRKKELYTEFSAVTIDDLERAGILEILSYPIYATTATLSCLKTNPKIHPVVVFNGRNSQFAKLIINENTTTNHPEGKRALRILRELLRLKAICEEFCVAVGGNTEGIAHSVKGIKDEDLEEVCARPKMDYRSKIISVETERFYTDEKKRYEKESTRHRVITRIYCNVGQS